MKNRQNLSTNHLCRELSEAQLAEIQGGGKHHKDRPRDFKPNEKPEQETLVLALMPL